MYVQFRCSKLTILEYALLEYLTGKSNADKEEMALFIWDTFQIIVSESALTRLLNKKKWTKKIVHFL